MKEDIKKTYEKASKEYSYNSNSLHKLGLEARKLEEAATNQILSALNLKDYDVIYTSGNAESFTMILNNIKENVLTDNQNIIDICKERNIPITNINNATKNTFISVIDEDFYNGKINHIDLDLNKTYTNLNKYDLITIEDDIPFFGVLIKKKNMNIENLIHGGKSTTIYRSGTSVTPLIAAFSKLIKLKYKK